jgi:hypothetical protein
MGNKSGTRWSYLSKNVNWTSKADYMASFACIVWMSELMHSLLEPSKIAWQDFKRSWPRSMMCSRQVSWGTLPSALRRTETTSSTYCNCKEPMDWPFDSLRSFAVKYIMKTKYHKTCCTIFLTCLLTSNHAVKRWAWIFFHAVECIEFVLL